MLELWELGGRDDCRFSTFSWRTRLALHHKGLAFDVHPVAVSDKAAIAFSGQSKVPILKHGRPRYSRFVGDRASIWSKNFPIGRRLFGGPVGQTPHALLQPVDGPRTHPGARPLSDARRARLRRARRTARILRAQIEGIFKKSLEELYGRTREGVASASAASCSRCAKCWRPAPIILAAPLRPMRTTSCSGSCNGRASSRRRRCSKMDDVVAAWFERVLDLLRRRRTQRTIAPRTHERRPHENRHRRRRSRRALFRAADEEAISGLRRRRLRAQPGGRHVRLRRGVLRRDARQSDGL